MVKIVRKYVKKSRLFTQSTRALETDAQKCDLNSAT